MTNTPDQMPDMEHLGSDLSNYSDYIIRALQHIPSDDITLDGVRNIISAAKAWNTRATPTPATGDKEGNLDNRKHLLREFKLWIDPLAHDRRDIEAYNRAAGELLRSTSNRDTIRAALSTRSDDVRELVQAFENIKQEITDNLNRENDDVVSLVIISTIVDETLAKHTNKEQE